MSFSSLRIGRMKTPFVETAPAVLTVLCVAFSSAQDMIQPEVYKRIRPLLMALRAKNLGVMISPTG